MKRVGDFIGGTLALALLVAFLYAVKSSGPPSAPPIQQTIRQLDPVAVKWAKSADGKDVVIAVIGQLIDLCPRLTGMRQFVESVSYEWMFNDPCCDYMAKAYGWRTRLEVGFILGSGFPIPPELQGKGPIYGDHMFFDVGGGRHPGVEVDKWTSRYACGQAMTNSENVLIADPSMSFLDEAAPKAPQRSR